MTHKVKTLTLGAMFIFCSTMSFAMQNPQLEKIDGKEICKLDLSYSEIRNSAARFVSSEIKELYMPGCEYVTEEFFLYITRNITDLDISECPLITNGVFLYSFLDLKSLSLEGNKALAEDILDGECNVLQTLSELRTLNVYGCDVTEKQVEYIVKNTSVTELTIGEKYSTYYLTFACLKNSNIEKLTLKNFVFFKELSILKNLPESLTHLKFIDCTFASPSVFFENFPDGVDVSRMKTKNEDLDNHSIS
jgi:hypothetical protein